MASEQVGSVSYTASIDTSKIKSDAQSIENTVENVSAKGDAEFKKFAKSASVGFAAVGVAVAAGLGVAVKSAGEYESSLSQLAQASGATGDQMAQMSALARELGQSNDLAGVSAANAAETMVELSKAGLSVTDTMDATKSVMALAKAGNIEFADAAVIAASALNAFGLKGSDAIKVADTLAAGANASQAELGDLAYGLQASATVAKQFGLNLNESVTALALFANNGIKGSDAGTSLKTMLIALAKPSDGAADAMKKIGFSAYDAKGQFVGLDEMSKRLKKSTENLTQEQKQNTLATIFGTDAFRAASVLSENAGDSYADMSKKLNVAGSAQKAAAAQMGAYEKSVEGAKNASSDLALTVGQELAPFVTRAVTAFSGFISTVNSGFPGAVSTVKSLLPVITSLSAGIVAFTVVQNAAAVATKALTIAQGALNFVMKANPLALAAGAAIAIGVAYVQASNGANSAKNASESLKIAQDNLKLSTDALKTAQDALKGALYDQEGAQLRVEQSQNNLNTAIANYGPNSLEARQAAHDLKGAQDDLAKATQNVKDQTNASVDAQNRIVKDKDAIIAANKAIAGSAAEMAGGFQNIAAQASAAKTEIEKVQKSGGTVSAKTQLTSAGLPSLNIPHKAGGGSVSAGSPYFVGDNPDGSLNRTSELFVPQTSGSIVNSKDLQSALGGSGSRIENNIGTITIGDKVTADYFLRKLSGDQEITTSGLVPLQKYMG